MIPVPTILLYLSGNLILFLLLIAIIARLACQIVSVQGESMSPTLAPGDRLVLLYWWPKRLLRKGQIVVSRPNQIIAAKTGQKIITGREFYHIKRIIATAGETVAIPLSDIETSHPPRRLVQYHDEHGMRSWDIPPGHVFVRGDSHINSIDSVTFGPLPFEKIDGVILMKLPRTFLLLTIYRFGTGGKT